MYCPEECEANTLCRCIISGKKSENVVSSELKL